MLLGLERAARKFFAAVQFFFSQRLMIKFNDQYNEFAASSRVASVVNKIENRFK